MIIRLFLSLILQIWYEEVGLRISRSISECHWFLDNEGRLKIIYLRKTSPLVLMQFKIKNKLAVLVEVLPPASETWQ